MTLREQVKAELDKVADDCMGVVFRMIKALEPAAAAEDSADSWRKFVASTYGCCADAPFERAEQGELEMRDPLR